VVINNKWNAAQELVESGKNGFIADNSPIDLANKVKSILDDDNLIDLMSSESIKKSKGFDWDSIVIDLEKYYLRVLANEHQTKY